MAAVTSVLVASLATAVAMPHIAAPAPLQQNWCQVGHLVMIPDGREGPVTSLDGDICRILVYGEGYVSLWAYYLVEPVYPQDLPFRKFGH